MSDYITKQCPVCNKEYLADTNRLKHGRQTTCSRECSYKYRSEKLSKQADGKKETRVCMNCEALVVKPIWSFKHKGAFCNRECYHEYRAKLGGYERKKRVQNCLICNKSFHPKDRDNKYCSRKCFEISHKETMQGSKNPSYIDGRSKKKTYDAGTKWHEIRLKAYIRDNYNCQICGVKCVSKKAAMKDPSKNHLIIQCHHINPYKQSKDNSLDNLITLCIVCHRGVHDGKHKIRLETIRKNQLKLF